MKQIILITGGERSGKSIYAENRALTLSDNPIYLATARVLDEDFKKRVREHQERRKKSWENREEEKFLSSHDVSDRVVLIDCVTLWCTNFFCDFDLDIHKALELIKKEFDQFTQQEATFIFVTNEIGMGGISSNEVQRRFTDLQGWVNQYIASKADEVVLMVSGIPIKIKG